MSINVVDAIVIGAGPAGVTAALEMSRNGLSVVLVEQRTQIGGAIYCQPVAGAERDLSVGGKRWQSLANELFASAVTLRTGCVFLGIDGDGVVMIEDRESQTVERLRARAVIVAIGAIERVFPRPGWDLAGVSTVGGLQVMLKQTGRAPAGRVLLAGSGPLLLALAAQMCRAGNPPVAIIESGNPLRHSVRGLGLLKHPKILAQALGYMAIIKGHRVPWKRGTSLTSIERKGTTLLATVEDARGRIDQISVDRIGLHDGIQSNGIGLSHYEKEAATQGYPLIFRAGDAREALGAIAAEADGKCVAREVITELGGKSKHLNLLKRRIASQRQLQSLLSSMFAPDLSVDLPENLPPETVICRCEGKTVGDLLLLLGSDDRLSGREIKHNGRFAMGQCQGRFCAHTVTGIIARHHSEKNRHGTDNLTGKRWPLRPVSIGSLVSSGSPKKIK